MVASRWPWRFDLAASISLATSAGVKCSRLRYSTLGRRCGRTRGSRRDAFLRRRSSLSAWSHFNAFSSVIETVGLVNTVLNSSAGALSKAGNNLDQIASVVFRAKGDQAERSRIYSNTLGALGREDEKISNLRESMVTIERLLLFLPKAVRDTTRAALRDLKSLEEDASFKAQKIQFLLDATLGLINLAQNDVIKLFSVLAVIFMPPTVIASIYGMNFKEMPELEWHWGYPLAIILMVCAAIGPYLFFRWKKWL